MADIVKLELTGDRQDDIRHRCRGRHEQIRHGQKIEFRECLIGLAAVGVGQHGVAAHHVGRPDRVGNILQDGLAEKSRGDGHEPGDDTMMSADHLFGLGGNEVGPDQRSQSDNLRIMGLHVAAWNIEVAADCHQIDKGAGRIEGMGVMLDGVSPLNDGRFGLGIEPGGLTDQVGRHPGDFRNFFGRVCFDMLGQLRESVGPLLYKLLIIETFFNDDVQKSQGQGVIRSGS